MKKLFRNLGPVLGPISITLTLSLTACDRSANSATGGTADDSLQQTQSTGLNLHIDTNKLDRAKDTLRHGFTNVAKDVGRGLERAGQEIQGAVSNSTTNH